MGLFGNPSAQGGPPVESVRQLRSQNRNDHEIIDLLSKQGYSSIDIYNALNQADQAQSAPMNQSVDPQGYAPQQPQQQAAQPYPPQDPNTDPWAAPQNAQNEPQGAWAAPQNPQAQSPDAWGDPPVPDPGPSAAPIAPARQPAPQYEPPMAPAPQPQPQQAYRPEPARSVFSGPSVTAGADSIDQIDQIAEAIIDEKWKQLKAYIEKIVEWKGKVESRIIAIEQNQKRLDEQIIGLQKSLVDKVQVYDRHITDVGTEIKAMEKVFQKIIPSLTENVNELSNVVHRMKDER